MWEGSRRGRFVVTRDGVEVPGYLTWGYNGEGCLNLATAIVGVELARAYLSEVIQHLPQSKGWTITAEEVETWKAKQKGQQL